MMGQRIHLIQVRNRLAKSHPALRRPGQFDYAWRRIGRKRVFEKRHVELVKRTPGLQRIFDRIKGGTGIHRQSCVRADDLTDSGQAPTIQIQIGAKRDFETGNTTPVEALRIAASRPDRIVFTIVTADGHTRDRRAGAPPAGATKERSATGPTDPHKAMSTRLSARA